MKEKYGYIISGIMIGVLLYGTILEFILGVSSWIALSLFWILGLVLIYLTYPKSDLLVSGEEKK